MFVKSEIPRNTGTSAAPSVELPKPAGLEKQPNTLQGFQVTAAETTGQVDAAGARLSTHESVELIGSTLVLPKVGARPQTLGTVDRDGNYKLSGGEQGNVFLNSDIIVTTVGRTSPLQPAQGQVASANSIISSLRQNLTQTGQGIMIVGIDMSAEHLASVSRVAVGHPDYSVAPGAKWVNSVIRAGKHDVRTGAAGLDTFIDDRVGVLADATAELNKVVKGKADHPEALSRLRVVNISAGNSIQGISAEIHQLLTTEPYASHFGPWREKIFPGGKLPESRDEQFGQIQAYIKNRLEKSGDFATTIKNFGAAVDAAAKQNISVVVAAGNVTPDVPLADPGNSFNLLAMSPNVISVAASNTNRTPTDLKDDFVRLSGRSLKLNGETFSPSITAPGELIQVARPISATDQRLGVYVENGSSLSAPIVSGALALMFEAAPGLSTADAARIIRTTATDTAAPESAEGKGMLDIVRAVKEASARK